MKQKDVFYAVDSPELAEASEKAQSTFKYFWRELWWDNRRMIPALDFSCVKVAFSQNDSSGKPEVEFMWINEVEFDGVYIEGILINQPEKLTNVKEGDSVKITLEELKDWIYSVEGKAYGGYTVHVLRSNMGKIKRMIHDKAWGLDFGDSKNILVAFDQEKHPENLIDHPMNVNMEDSLKNYLTQNPGEVTKKDEFGYTMLHREAIAGNRGCVEVILEMGADKDAKTNSGFTAYDFAKKMGWDHLVEVLK